MSAFDATYKRLQNIRTRMPEFPLELMRLLRMTYHIQKGMKDLTNAILKKHDLVDASYMVLAVLYGTDEESSNACTLGMACHEKPANLTRVCNDLEERGLIQRGTRPGDRRSVMITLTDPGRALIEEILPQVYEKTTLVYDGFTAAELEQMEQMFARQLRNLNNIT
ncbi:MarR family transcriptional regulator [Janthinobacterium sp.]|uniref:MarR family transcriptional regulator n=1 Tax=Janthinobacterium sp. TaxID=1871054 RepID=UPI00293D9064|nr:MarR family transcriptional regulator [Janthinobacterium sp.]